MDFDVKILVIIMETYQFLLKPLLTFSHLLSNLDETLDYESYIHSYDTIPNIVPSF